ncbi:MAG: hypothetical protein EOM59_08755 [Clostridia bacterium]|nr:hypothetical protein [Clostridia bacterium]
MPAKERREVCKRIVIIFVAVLAIACTSVPVVNGASDTIELFTDVNLDYWAFEPIYTLVSAEVLNGYPDGTFKPLSSITRAEIAAMLCRGFEVLTVEGKGKFTDLSTAEWAEKYINPLTDQGIFLGVGEGLFDPNSNITNAEVAVLMIRLIDKINPTADYINQSPMTPTDTNIVPSWAQTQVKEALSYEVMNLDSNGNFNPKEILTREKLSDIILKTMKVAYNKSYGIKPIVEKEYGDYWESYKSPIYDPNCDGITKKFIRAYESGPVIYEPIENNINAKWSTWRPYTTGFIKPGYDEALEKDGYVLNENGQKIIIKETMQGEEGLLYRYCFYHHQSPMYVYEIRQETGYKVIYPGTM